MSKQAERISKLATSLFNCMRKSQGPAHERNMIVIQHEAKEVYQPTSYWIRRNIQIWKKSAPHGHGKMETRCLSQNSFLSIWVRVDDAARQGKCQRFGTKMKGTSMGQIPEKPRAASHH